MGPEQLSELLEKYWNAESSLEEEAMLKAHFLKQESSDDETLEAYFTTLRQDAADRTKRHFPRPDIRVKPVRPLTMRRAFSIAAAVLLLIIAGIFVQKAYHTTQNQSSVMYEDTFDDPEIAYAEAKEALLLLAAKMDRSRQEVAEQMAKTEPYTSLINVRNE